MINPMLMVDGYKLGHHNQYPEGMTYLFSNFTARNEGHFKNIAVKKYMDNSVVVFGTSAVVKYIQNVWDEYFFRMPREAVVGEFADIVRVFLNDPEFSVDHVYALWDLGYLPIHFTSLPEGTLCKIGVPFFTIENTHKDFAWLVNYLETQLSAMLWKPVTSATIARHYKVILNDFYNQTCDHKDGIDFMVHDFSMRGLGNVFDAYFSGMAHMTSFSGSDNLPAILGVRDFYGHDARKDFLVGGVPATEHSVTSSNIRTFMELDGIDNLEAEKKTIEYLFGKHPTGFLSYVSDTYDYFGVLTDVLPALKDKIMAREGRFVVRPDSGDPLDIICGAEFFDYSQYPEIDSIQELGQWAGESMVDDEAQEAGHGECGASELSKIVKWNDNYYEVFVEIEWNRYDKQYYYVDGWKVTDVKGVFITPEQKGTLELLWETFGGTINNKGYRVLDSHIGLIYGDSITPSRMYDILTRMKEMGFAASNVVFGAGSFTYQYTTRDTFGMAMKATYCAVDGVPIKLFKDPKTGDGSKKSAKGMLVVQDGKLVDDMDYDEYCDKPTELRPVGFDNVTFSEIRQRINVTIKDF